jgi:hypothetical protein
VNGESPLALSTSAAAAPQTVVQPVNWEAAVALVERGARLRGRRWRLHLGAAAVLGTVNAFAQMWWGGAWFTALLVGMISTPAAMVVLIPARLVISLIDRGLMRAHCREEGCRADVIADAIGLTAKGEMPAAALVKTIKVHGGLRSEGSSPQPTRPRWRSN